MTLLIAMWLANLVAAFVALNIFGLGVFEAIIAAALASALITTSVR